MAEQRKREYEPSDHNDSISIRLQKRPKTQNEQEEPSASTGVFARLSYAYEIKNENTLSSTAAIKTWRQSIKMIVPITPIELCAPMDYILKFLQDEKLRRDATLAIESRKKSVVWSLQKKFDQVGDYKRTMQHVYPVGHGNIDRVFLQWCHEQNAFLDRVEQDLGVKMVHASEIGIHLGLSFSTPINPLVEILCKIPVDDTTVAPKLDPKHLNTLSSLPHEVRKRLIASKLDNGISFIPNAFFLSTCPEHYQFNKPSEWLSAYLQGLKDGTKWFQRLSSLFDNNEALLEDIEGAESVWREGRKERAQQFMDAVIWRTCRTLEFGNWRVEGSWAFVGEEWKELLRQWRSVSAGIEG